MSANWLDLPQRIALMGMVWYGVVLKRMPTKLGSKLLSVQPLNGYGGVSFWGQEKAAPQNGYFWSKRVSLKGIVFVSEKKERNRTRFGTNDPSEGSWETPFKHFGNTWGYRFRDNPIVFSNKITSGRVPVYIPNA